MCALAMGTHEQRRRNLMKNKSNIGWKNMNKKREQEHDKNQTTHEQEHGQGTISW